MQESILSDVVQENNFDEDTGFIKDEFEEQRLKSYLEDVVTQAEAFLEMKKTKGWMQVEEFVKKMTEQLTKSLITECEFEKIRRIQSEILAFDSLLSIVEKSILDSHEAKKQLEVLNSDSETL